MAAGWLGITRPVRACSAALQRLAGRIRFDQPARNISSSSESSSSIARTGPIRKVDLATAFGRIDEPWDPCVVADVNEFQVKLARMEGEFVWHHHEEEDELFLVVRGRMRMQFRPEHGGDIELGPGELIAVPRGVEHCPLAVTESCDVVLLERASTLNTGSAAAEIRDFEHKASKAKLPLTKMELKRL